MGVFLTYCWWHCRCPVLLSLCWVSCSWIEYWTMRSLVDLNQSGGKVSDTASHLGRCIDRTLEYLWGRDSQKLVLSFTRGGSVNWIRALVTFLTEWTHTYRSYRVRYAIVKPETIHYKLWILNIAVITENAVALALMEGLFKGKHNINGWMQVYNHYCIHLHQLTCVCLQQDYYCSDFHQNLMEDGSRPWIDLIYFPCGTDVRILSYFL